MEISNEPAATEQELKNLSRFLFDNAMRGHWDKVVESYKTNEDSHEAVLTASEDTALHLAVSGGKPMVVKDMVQSLGGKAQRILKMKNGRGNTPLHTAAALGDAYMCHCMAKTDRSLIGECNNEKATPLFLAALFGHQEAFLCLHFLYQGNQSDISSRKANGDTFLHAALKGEFFEVANSVNENGCTPLHILATKPSAFPSGRRLGLLDQIIYRCLTVHETEEIENDPGAYLKRFQETKEPGYPRNSATCAEFFHMLFGVVFYGWPLEKIRSWKVSCFHKSDEENAGNSKPGFQRIRKIIIKKERHIMALQVMNELMERTCLYKFNEGGSVGDGVSDISFDPREAEAVHHRKKIETPFLIAAKMGVTEMVESILEKFPVSIQDSDANGKNVLLLAVENRQTHTFQFLVNRKTPLHESVFRKWDDQGNNALHLAAKYGEYRPWLIPGSALQMQWELKWYKFVKRSISKHLLIHYNHKNQTPKQIFTQTHKALVKEGSEWLTKTSDSCSLVAALIPTVAFATSATIPGGVNENSGKPVLGDEPAFAVFSISSLIALCFSVTALVFFLAILTSRFEEKDFACKLPWKLIIGLTALFTSITAVLVSFCAGHFFELRDKLKFAAFPIYVVACLPVSFFALAQLPLYFDLLRAILKDIPQRSNKEFTR
ncbi:hypothetical protein V6N13_091259 [Hibiscus sabdariffa]|uniref:PGG domain-containing protein n=1 Tax=Hibiscus sabdariffa TaxID=183260 RepID=A0ABR2BUW6_9ROSI